MFISSFCNLACATLRSPMWLSTCGSTLDLCQFLVRGILGEGSQRLGAASLLPRFVGEGPPGTLCTRSLLQLRPTYVGRHYASLAC